MPVHHPDKASSAVTRVGVISDTHGLLRPEALAWLRGCHYIIHGGDIGRPQILEDLASIAPITAVRGNIDIEPWAATLRDTERLDLDRVSLYVIHDVARLDVSLAEAGIRVVVHGHSHEPSVEERGGVLFVNPGSAGPRRFRLPITVGELIVTGRSVSARIVELVTTPGAP